MIPESQRCLDDNELASYVDGSGSVEARARHEEHLGHCPQCGATLAVYAKALSTSDAAPEEERYRIDSLIGRGSMGSVYRAYDHALKRTIALKFLGVLGRNSDQPERFDSLEREAVALAKLSHPNVVGIYEIGVLDGKSYAAMEYVDGMTLTGWLDNKERSWTEILSVLIQSGQGILAAHQAGVVHRDIKPSNILVGSDKRVRIVDFGLARTRRTIEGEPTVADSTSVVTSMAGTPAYRAPELGPHQPASPTSDQFSFCVTAYEALCGARPKEASKNESLCIPSHILPVLERGLSPDPDDRYGSMRELLNSFDVEPVKATTGIRKPLLFAAVGVLSALILSISFRAWRSPTESSGALYRSTQIQSVQTRRDRIKEWGDKGQYTEGLALCNELLVDARRISHAPLTTKLLLDKGQMQTLLSDLAGAEKTYREAASTAARGGDNHQVAEVWIKVIDVLTLQNRFDEALTLRMVAITSVERVPEDAILQARLHRSLGAIYFALGRYPEAYEAFETALSAFRTLGQDAPKWLPSLLGNLALAKMELGDLSGALADMEEAKTLSIENLGPDHPQVGYLLLNIASLLTTMNSLASALDNLEETETIFRKGFDKNHPNFAYVFEQRAIIASLQERFPEAEEHLRAALRLRKASLGDDNIEILRTLQVLAMVYIEQGTAASIVRAEETIEQVFSLHTKIGETSVMHRPDSLRSRAALSEFRHDWESAISDRKTVLRMQIESDGESHPKTGKASLALGRVLEESGDTIAALSACQKALTIFEAHSERTSLEALEARDMITRLSSAADQPAK